MPRARDTTIRRVGSVRPSQLLYSFGVGSIIDLPSFSVLVGGLDDWDANRQQRLSEERLLAAVRAHPGMATVHELREPPWMPESRDAFGDWAYVGVPVSPFPRWLRCSKCRVLAPIESSLFKLETWPYRPDRARYVHRSCGSGRPPTASPARFVIACSRGHLDEFPWIAFVHKDQPCSGNPVLESVDTGISTRSTDVLVKCRSCPAKRSVAQAFGDGSEQVLPRCRGRHPHLHHFDPNGCPEQARAVLVGASNAWFPVTLTVLSIPSGGSTVEQLVLEHWATLKDVTSREILAFALKQPGLGAVAELDPDGVWKAIEAQRDGTPAAAAEPDLEGPEWEVFCDPASAPNGPDFTLRPSEVPTGWGRRFRPTVLADRLREVTAMVSFTRLDGPDLGRPSGRAPLAGQVPSWVPASQTRGEGIFLRLSEDAVQEWEDRVAGTPRLEALRRGHQEWRRRRNLEPASAGWPGERYVLLHSLAHALINDMALECGYPAASIRERIYSRERGLGSEPRAGILLYTAAPDAEGTLGGLISAGDPDRLGLLLRRIADRPACASDPMCSEHQPSDEDGSLHGAACHACLFVPETSCERGNRYLDRSTLGPTLAEPGLGFLA